jgi:ABC-type transport system substrate-binding protein
MRRFSLRLLVASSLFVASMMAAVRPHYGGTLRVLMRAAPAGLDPADLDKAVVGDRNLARFLYDTLVFLDDRGIAQPELAASWQSDPSNQRWQLSLRPGVSFSDGSPLTTESVAAALRVANPNWQVSTDAEAVVIQLDSPDGDLPAELALVRNSVVRRVDGRLSGTGPFTVTQWQPGKRLTLTAREDYWNGRPFLASIEIDLNSDPNPQMIDWSRYQLAEMASGQARRAGGSGHNSETSAASDLLALVFTNAATSTEEGQLRDALSLSIDRKILNDVLLHGGGEPARGLLPGWMTGYDFLFSVETNVAVARQAVAEIRQETPWRLGYDANDPAARLMAERIALNANDAGLKLITATNGVMDARLIRLSMSSLDPHVALASLAARTGMTPPRFTVNSSEQLYASERALLQTQRVIPLVHLKVVVSLAGTINNWTSSRSGDWHLADVWLGAEKQ